jgi:hypothetical protein
MGPNRCRDFGLLFGVARGLPRSSGRPWYSRVRLQVGGRRRSPRRGRLTVSREFGEIDARWHGRLVPSQAPHRWKRGTGREGGREVKEGKTSDGETAVNDPLTQLGAGAESRKGHHSQLNQAAKTPILTHRFGGRPSNLSPSSLKGRNSFSEGRSPGGISGRVGLRPSGARRTGEPPAMADPEECC